MSEAKAFEQDYHGEKAVWLTCGNYEAAVLPELGANLIAFRDTKHHYRFLHEPEAEEMAAFKQRPGIYGIPILYPPNRYEDGKFPWNGEVYQFPVNEEKTGNHLHSYAHKSSWVVVDYGNGKTESFVKLQLKVKEGNEIFRYFPYKFTLQLKYTLSEHGLGQQVKIYNEDEAPIPSTLAFHTAINAPFAPNSQASDYKVKLTAGQRWELDERMLPTGNYQALTKEEKQLISTGMDPFWQPLDHHYTSSPQHGRNRMVLTDHKEKVTLVYDVGTSYKQWMLWNNSAEPGFFCPEPQVNLVNAPNAVRNKDFPFSADEIGLFSIAPGEIWEENASLYIVKEPLS